MSEAMRDGFPGESAAYRAARNQLLTAEKDLRARVETVASLRRSLPLGGKIPTDYAFEEVDLGHEDRVAKMRLSELFEPGMDTLVLYSLMFAPGGTPCPMCTAFVDGLNGNARHIRQRVALAVAAKAPPAALREFARSRGWHELRLLSSHGNSYNRDYRAEGAQESQQLTMLNVFRRTPQGIFHHWASELRDPEPGQDPRHLDMMWPVWNVLDLTPEGRGKDWRTKLSYG